MLGVNREKAENGMLCLKLSGEATIQNAEVLRETLVNAFQEESSLRVSLANLSELDLTCMQLFCAAHHTALATKKHLVLDNDMTEQIDNLVTSSGLKRSCGCGYSEDPSSCVWAKEATK